MDRIQDAILKQYDFSFGLVLNVRLTILIQHGSTGVTQSYYVEQG